MPDKQEFVCFPSDYYDIECCFCPECHALFETINLDDFVWGIAGLGYISGN